MPIVESSYKPPIYLRNPNLQTIYPRLFRKTPKVNYVREAISTHDNDFLDLDWSFVTNEKKISEKMAILCHGLEGCSRKKYELTQAYILNRAGLDIAALNYRGCSGRPNKLLKSYHSGKTEDLQTVIEHVLKKNYQEIYLVGTSIGGNIILKYLGEKAVDINTKIKKTVVFSVPVDLASTAKELARPSRTIYMINFLSSLYKKVKIKKRLFPGQIDDKGFLTKIRTFADFDDKYTAPLNGFASAEDYWQKASSRDYLTRINIPTLIITAKDDPFLAEESYPVGAALSNSNLFLECVPYGGHCGFVEFNKDYRYYHERRMLEFFNS